MYVCERERECVCARLCVCLCVCEGMCMFCVCRIEVDIRCCPHCSLPYVLRQGLSLNLELMDKARLTGQQEQPLPRSDPSVKIIVTRHPGWLLCRH